MHFFWPADGESLLKESRNIEIDSSAFDLRYAFWHVVKDKITKLGFLNTARAPFWYCKDIEIDNVNSKSVKVFRECENVRITNSIFESEEPF